MKLLKFLNHYNPLELIYLYNQNSRFTRFGVFFGFPSCCIQAFIKGETQQVMKNYPNLPSNGTGYVPCPSCALKVIDNWSAVQKEIQNRRTFSMPFPQDNAWSDNCHDTREVSQFKKIFSRHITRNLKNIHNIQLDLKKEINRPASEFKTLQNAYEQLQGNNFLDKIIDSYLNTLESMPLNSWDFYLKDFAEALKDFEMVLQNLIHYEDKISLLIHNNYCLTQLQKNTRDRLSKYIIKDLINETFHSLHLLKSIGRNRLVIHEKELNFEQIIVAYIIYYNAQKLSPVVPFMCIYDEMGYYIPQNLALSIARMYDIEIVQLSQTTNNLDRFIINKQEALDQSYTKIRKKRYKYEDILSIYESIADKKDMIHEMKNFNLSDMNQSAKEKFILQELHNHLTESKKFKI